MALKDLARSPLRALAWAAGAATVALAVVVRLRDPLSSSVIPAEDPYTHMALIRGHLADGNVEPLFEGGTLYPPGMHALLAAVHAFTGADLYDIFRVGPAVLGAIGVLGVAVLLYRNDGAVAALVGAMAFALAPEAIFRTTMMAPTAVDLALLPFMFYGILELFRGRMGWAGPTAAVAAYLIIAHPWTLAVVVPAGLVMVVLALIVPWPERVAPSVVIGGAATVLIILAAALGTAVTFCMEQCGLGFDDVSLTPSTGLDLLALIIAATCAAGAALLLGFRNRVAAFQSYLRRRPLRPVLRIATTVAVVASVAILTWPAIQNGMPEFVDLPRMFGWPILGLAAVGLTLLVWAPRPATHWGAALVAVTYPFVIHNPFESEFWPHRTAVFLGLGLVLLAGATAGAAVRAGASTWAAVSRRQGLRSKAVRSVTAGALVSLALTVSLAGTVYAATPDEYEGGWYRLYPECEFEALRTLAEDAVPGTVLITASWQSKLVLAAFTDTPEDVWYSDGFFYDSGRREATLRGLGLEGRDAIVILERQQILENPNMPTEYLAADPWVPLGTWCTSAIPEPRVKAYIAEASA